MQTNFKTFEQIEKQCKELLDNNYTGLKLSSNTNKTRYSILSLLEDARQLGREEKEIELFKVI